MRSSVMRLESARLAGGRPTTVHRLRERAPGAVSARGVSAMTRAVIQAGGKGARLYPYTKVLPKPLMPVGDRPILEIVIRQLAAYGFEDIHITVGYLGEMIRLCCGDGARWGVRIRYCTEAKPLGTM